MEIRLTEMLLTMGLDSLLFGNNNRTLAGVLFMSDQLLMFHANPGCCRL